MRAEARHAIVVQGDDEQLNGAGERGGAEVGLQPVDQIRRHGLLGDREFRPVGK
jgi:hypothetical protein